MKARAAWLGARGLLLLLICHCSAAALSAQAPADEPVSKPVVTVGGSLLIYPGPINDPSTRTTWSTTSAFGIGAGVHRPVGRRLLLGVDVFVAPLVPFSYRQNGSGAGPFRDGDAKLASMLATGRLYVGRVSALDVYVAGGGGGFFWGIPKLTTVSGGCLESDPPVCSKPIGGWDPDLAFLAGAGLEYRGTTRLDFFLEGSHWWTFHQPPEDGGADGSNLFTAVKFGARLPI